MKTIIYSRVSTGRQAEEGASLDMQRKQLQAYAVAYGLEIVAELSDDVSAKSLERAGLQAGLDMLRAGMAEALLVYKLDRLTRSVVDMGWLIAEYFGEKKPWRLMSLSDSLDTKSANGRLMINLLTTVAQWERETNGERVRAVNKVLKERGRKLGGRRPFGARVVDGMLVRDEAEVRAYHDMVAMQRRGVSTAGIAQIVAEEYGVSISPAGVWKVLKNGLPRYAEEGVE
jgi:site-specific DNA recombinase